MTQKIKKNRALYEKEFKDYEDKQGGAVEDEPKNDDEDSDDDVCIGSCCDMEWCCLALLGCACSAQTSSRLLYLLIYVEWISERVAL